MVVHHTPSATYLTYVTTFRPADLATFNIRDLQLPGNSIQTLLAGVQGWKVEDLAREAIVINIHTSACQNLARGHGANYCEDIASRRMECINRCSATFSEPMTTTGLASYLPQEAR
jgi:hypothetical protein